MSLTMIKDYLVNDIISFTETDIVFLLKWYIEFRNGLKMGQMLLFGPASKISAEYWQQFQFAFINLVRNTT